MRSNYERNKYKWVYLLVSILFLLLSAGWVWYAWGGFTWKTGVLFLFFICFLSVIFGISYRNIHHVYWEIENVSEIMAEIMEGGEELPAEEYREGAAGVLYTNLYKMVGVLQESRNREMQEKVFLRDIISDISHQLKTPLASLNVFVDLLLEDKITEPEKKKQVLNEAANQLDRMEWMVLSMLKLARIEAGAIQFENRSVLLEPILLQAIEGVQYLVKERKQEISVTCPDGAVLLCDGDWLTEALINLLKNASDYSEEGKPIRIEVELSNVYTRLYVKDEGMGIPETELPNVFKRFYRVHREVNPNSVGIGLSLTKSIVEGMGGSIRVNSREGEYTWFVLTFVK